MASLDIFIRGGVCALALLLAVLLLRQARGALAARLGVMFAVGIAALAVSSSAALAQADRWWWLPLQAFAVGNNVVFFLFASALFDDDFRLTLWHRVLWSAVVLAGVVCMLGLPLGGAIRPLLDGSALLFAALGGIKALSAWSQDLVERRRRLRLFVVLASTVYIGVTATADILGLAFARPTDTNLLASTGLVIIIGIAAGALLQVDPAQAPFPIRPDTGAAARPSTATVADPADAVAIAAIEQTMRVERLYRREGLTIAQLAAHLGMPEHRLRRLINQRLGHRNFNAFLNGWRLRDVKEALSDPAQAEVPILTIALDAGFSSLGPFNRAFKAETGMTPTEYRRAGLARAAAAPADSEIGEPFAISTSSFPTSA